jgi:amino-acid N-acetyltransferase
VSGNYVAAKRRGVVDGVDFGYTGEVRFVVRDAVKRQLENDNIVLLSNLGEGGRAVGLVRWLWGWLGGL